VRTQARALITVATMGVLAASYQFGTTAQTGLLLGAPAATANTSGSPEPTAAASDAATPAATPTATADATSSSAAPATPTVTKSPSTAPTKAPVAAVKTATGAAIDYKYGTVQLKVTQSSGAITDVSVLVGFGSGPQYTDLIASLAQYAVAANGSNFGNVSRATLTTNAFKQALDSAIAKL
jgi:uncharacterized protein with FMN-binding domain